MTMPRGTARDAFLVSSLALPATSNPLSTMQGSSAANMSGSTREVLTCPSVVNSQFTPCTSLSPMNRAPASTTDTSTQAIRVANTPESTNLDETLTPAMFNRVDNRIRMPVARVRPPVPKSSKPSQDAMIGATATHEPATDTMWAISNHQPVCQPRNRPPSRETML